MKSWLTTHYPHPDPDTHPWHIYLQCQHKAAVSGIAIGDRVFYYEYKRQRPIKGHGKLLVGLRGIVRIAHVCGGLYHRNVKIEFADGAIGNYCWGIPTDRANTDGFVRLKDILDVLEYKPRSVLFGFNGGTGVKLLDDSQSCVLAELFATTPRPSR
ncbi:MAG TPA: hypothetical protein VFC78_10020 [Tepidisphaeraceae bacterium]|nr:hypothetical protein [Tepidisphaeraceae bacterium]